MKFEAPKKALVDKAFAKGLEACKEQILTDCNYHVRVDHGTLRDTSHADVNGNTLTATWDTPYAKRVYYTGTPSTDVNANASLMWAEKAEKEFGKDWQKQLQKAMRESL